ncbi:hypothetical protein OUZ56_011070 [Daphnia magna]|uniref:GMP synthase n=1 Tax=Daphnia magna TaxID=35525 RepID=A0ABQ9YZL2_9CRUS|nr:hypothetical protein OUZ56_011070 [Daphnia magna]
MMNDFFVSHLQVLNPFISREFFMSPCIMSLEHRHRCMAEKNLLIAYLNIDSRSSSFWPRAEKEVLCSLAVAEEVSHNLLLTLKCGFLKSSPSQIASSEGVEGIELKLSKDVYFESTEEYKSWCKLNIIVGNRSERSLLLAIRVLSNLRSQSSL